MEQETQQGGIAEYFSELEDPRRHSRRHNVLPVKDNQPRLLWALQHLFDAPDKMRWVEYDHRRTVNKGHGRIEVGECWCTSDPGYLAYIASLAEWPGLRSIAVVQGERQLEDERTMQRRYFVSSLESDAKLLLYAVRTHWEIEDKVHWVLDIAFREDDCRIRKDNGVENFAVLRHVALNLQRRETTCKSALVTLS